MLGAIAIVMQWLSLRWLKSDPPFSAVRLTSMAEMTLSDLYFGSKGGGEGGFRVVMSCVAFFSFVL